MPVETIETTPSATLADAGKYLTFVLGPESYGVEVLKIREIIRMVDITGVPEMPAYVKGVINLRGKIIPVLDLRVKFGLPAAGTTERTCIVVVQILSSTGIPMQMGLIVDGVEEVLNLTKGDIEETPDFGARVCTEYLKGMAKVKGKVTSLLDIDKVLGAKALEQVEAAAEA